jgi:hypothetical protein
MIFTLQEVAGEFLLCTLVLSEGIYFLRVEVLTEWFPLQLFVAAAFNHYQNFTRDAGYIKAQLGNVTSW